MSEPGSCDALEPRPRTENLHPHTSRDHLTSRDHDPAAWLELFDAEEGRVSAALSNAASDILALARAMARALGPGSAGRVISVGAGTSGRLGALDAAEWGPTFGIDRGRVVARIAGGPAALTRAIEGAEDDRAAGVKAIAALEVGPADLVIGISASGSAEYVRGALAEAIAQNATVARITAAIPSSLERSPLSGIGEDPTSIDVVLALGPELIAGSTRLQAATATHRVLQRASVLCAVECGWIYRGRMVEMRPTNRKLRARAVRMVAELAAVSEVAASRALEAAKDDIKVAIVSSALGIEAEVARDRLTQVDRRLDRVGGLL